MVPEMLLGWLDESSFSRAEARKAIATSAPYRCADDVGGDGVGNRARVATDSTEVLAPIHSGRGLPGQEDFRRDVAGHRRVQAVLDGGDHPVATLRLTDRVGIPVPGRGVQLEDAPVGCEPVALDRREHVPESGGDVRVGGAVALSGDRGGERARVAVDVEGEQVGDARGWHPVVGEVDVRALARGAQGWLRGAVAGDGDPVGPAVRGEEDLDPGLEGGGVDRDAEL